MDWLKLSRDIGFEDAAELNMDALCALDEVRDMCAAGKCKAYGKSWVCPPACGTLDYCKAKMNHYSNGILVQTIGQLSDEFDAEGISAAHKLHERRFNLLTRQIRSVMPGCLPLSAGTCTRCEVCTYPDKPCRYPKKMLSSMEAYGLLVSDVCNSSGMPYYRGEKTITFTSCVLLEEKER